MDNNLEEAKRLLEEALEEATLDEHDGSAPMGFVAEKIMATLTALENMEGEAKHPQRKQRTCSRCHGTGTVATAISEHSTSCHLCNGSGKRPVKPPVEEPEKGMWMGDRSIVEYEDGPGRCCMTDYFGYRCEKRTGHKGKHNVGNPKDPFYNPVDDPEKVE